MSSKGQRFYQKLLDGKTHYCEYIEQYAGTKLWLAQVIDNHGGYKYGQTFLCDPSY